MEDLLWLRQNGLEAAVLKAAASGTLIMGICGGYQMLGESLFDPYGVEAGGKLRGMGLLPMDTVFERAKTRTQTEGRFLEIEGAFSGLSGAFLKGYEIHMGTSTLKKDAKPLTLLTPAGEMDGAFAGNICGTYVHGIFDEEETLRALFQTLCRRRGLSPEAVKTFDMAAYKERQYDLLADAVRRNMDMEAVYRILKEGI